MPSKQTLLLQPKSPSKVHGGNRSLKARGVQIPTTLVNKFSHEDYEDDIIFNKPLRGKRCVSKRACPTQNLSDRKVADDSFYIDSDEEFDI
jgi:hypothetical protein